MIKHICDSCKGDYSEVESNHYRVRDNYRLVVTNKEGERLEICKACIGQYFFNLDLVNVNGEVVGQAPVERRKAVKK